MSLSHPLFIERPGPLAGALLSLLTLTMPALFGFAHQLAADVTKIAPICFTPVSKQGEFCFTSPVRGCAKYPVPDRNGPIAGQPGRRRSDHRDVVEIEI
jgi:hypothetical protein